MSADTVLAKAKAHVQHHNPSPVLLTGIILFAVACIIVLLILVLVCMFVMWVWFSLAVGFITMDPNTADPSPHIFQAGIVMNFITVVGIAVVVCLRAHDGWMRAIYKQYRGEYANMVHMFRHEDMSMKVMMATLVSLPRSIIFCDYIFVPFIIVDNPATSINDAQALSRIYASEVSDNLKVLRRKLIPHTLMCIATLGVGAVYVLPLRMFCWLLMYESVKKK